MALQKAFKQEYTEQLRTHINPADYYGDTFAYDESNVRSLMNVAHPEKLAEYMEEHYDNDFECAVALYDAYKNISPLLAQDERLWVYLSHCDLYGYLKKRWPLPEDKSKQLNFIRDHWFKGTRGLIRSSLLGLWWAVYCTVDESADDKYQLTKVLFSNYSFRTTFFGSTELFWYREGTKGILRFLMDNPDIVNQNFENRCQFLTKYFNQLGGIKQLASCDEQFFYKECERIKERILSVKSREDVQNKSALVSTNQ